MNILILESEMTYRLNNAQREQELEYRIGIGNLFRILTEGLQRNNKPILFVIVF